MELQQRDPTHLQMSAKDPRHSACVHEPDRLETGVCILPPNLCILFYLLYLLI